MFEKKYKLKIKTSDGMVHTVPFSVPYGEDGKDGVDGKDGANGKDGVTPIKGVDYLTPEEVNALKDVFIATYGQTSYADMIGAWRSGKSVILKGDVESALTIRTLVHVSTDKIFFGRVLAESKLVEEVIVTSANKWTLIKNNYLTKDDIANLPTGGGSVSKTSTKVFQASASGVIRCEPNMTYNFYCIDDTEATLRGYGTQNADKELSGKYLTVHCGNRNDSFTDSQGNTITGSTAALWYATSMTKGTITPIGSMEVKRGVLEHSDGNHYVEITYPASCSIIITENSDLTNASGVSF